MAAALGTGATLIALVAFGADAALGVAAGTVVGVGNFRLLRTLMAGMMLRDGSATSKALLGALSGFKFLALAGVVLLLLVWLRLDRVGFVVGFSALVVALPLAALRGEKDGTAAGEQT